MSASTLLIDLSLVKREDVSLSPELRRCLVSSEESMRIFQKLLTAVPYFPPWNGGYNDTLTFRKASLMEALAADDWHSYLMLHEPPYRLQAIRSIRHQLPDGEPLKFSRSSTRKTTPPREFAASQVHGVDSPIRSAG